MLPRSTGKSCQIGEAEAILPSRLHPFAAKLTMNCENAGPSWQGKGICVRALQVNCTSSQPYFLLLVSSFFGRAGIRPSGNPQDAGAGATNRS